MAGVVEGNMDSSSCVLISLAILKEFRWELMKDRVREQHHEEEENSGLMTQLVGVRP